jgi:hypothetical protein
MFKKYQVHTLFFVLLMVVLYLNPNVLSELTVSPLGKSLLLVFVIAVGFLFDNKAAFLAGLIVILLLQNVKEGMDVLEKPEKPVADEELIKEISKNVLNKVVEEQTKDEEVAINGGNNTGGDLLSNDLTRNQVDPKQSTVDPTANISMPVNTTNNDLELQPEIPKSIEGFALLS